MKKQNIFMDIMLIVITILLLHIALKEASIITIDNTKTIYLKPEYNHNITLKPDYYNYTYVNNTYKTYKTYKTSNNKQTNNNTTNNYNTTNNNTTNNYNETINNYNETTNNYNNETTNNYYDKKPKK